MPSSRSSSSLSSSRSSSSRTSSSRSHHGPRLAFEDDEEWVRVYNKIPKKQSKALSFLAWTLGMPAGTTTFMSKTRDVPDHHSSRSSSSSHSNSSETRMYWIKDGHSHRSSSSGRSHHSSSGHGPGHGHRSDGHHGHSFSTEEMRRDVHYVPAPMHPQQPATMPLGPRPYAPAPMGGGLPGVVFGNGQPPIRPVGGPPFAGGPPAGFARGVPGPPVGGF